MIHLGTKYDIVSSKFVGEMDVANNNIKMFCMDNGVNGKLYPMISSSEYIRMPQQEHKQLHRTRIEAWEKLIHYIWA